MPNSLFPFQRQLPRRRVQIWVRSPRPVSRLRILWQILALLILVSVAGLTLQSLWLSLRFIVNPNTTHWIERYLPQANSGLGQAQPQTLAAIEAELDQAGLSAGEIIQLQAAPSTADWLLPVLTPSPLCHSPCQHLVELRLYRASDRSAAPLLRLVDRLAVAGPTEETAIAPLVGSVLEHPGSARQLPFDAVQLLPPVEGQQNWLTLQGHWQRGQVTLLYGQLIQYDPAQSRLRDSLVWSSPTTQKPYWLDLDGVAPAELIINQSIGLEPRFVAYRLSGGQSSQIAVRSQPISFLEPALPGSLITSDYGKALLQARNGLWSAAAKTLTSLKQQLGQAWTTDAEAQLGLIQLHSQTTQQQAERTWASESQQILADLMDGRWSKALTRLEQTPTVYKEVETLLKQDSGRLWQRVTTALQVTPNQAEIQVWGMLILAAQQDQTTAQRWLARQDARLAAQSRYSRLLVALQPQPASPAQSVAQKSPAAAAAADTLPVATQPVASRHWNLMGFLTALYTVEPQSWFAPTGLQPAARDDQWYRIQINSLSDGYSGWQTPTATPTSRQAATLWQQLGLNTRPQVEVLRETATGFELATVTVKGLQVQGDRIWLLATSGDRLDLSQAALALSPDQLTLLEPAQTLTQPPNPNTASWVKTLQQIEKSEAASLPAHLQLQTVDVTGDRQPDVLVTTAASSVANSLTGLFILSPTGQLLYRNPAATQAVAIIRDRALPPALLLQDARNYQLVQWSEADQKFQ
ncbi:hypothetical protein [Almyronema epifaneia]|uniref:Uncharacterized protein n=1 Tax=Almyronema epifaneia S1 TaxID=2991925 RepID=A0ABW6IJB0_9CYAN